MWVCLHRPSKKGETCLRESGEASYYSVMSASSLSACKALCYSDMTCKGLASRPKKCAEQTNWTLAVHRDSLFEAGEVSKL